MNSEQENFDALRKLLALKKYEQPPPRYFSDLPTQIWARMEREPETLPFWQRILPNFGLSPAVAYSFGLLACGTLVFGIGYSLSGQSEQTMAHPIAEGGNWDLAPKLAAQESIGLNQLNRANDYASTNPVMTPDSLPSLFSGFKLRAEPANFSPAQ
ncbi:MAG: hypothetical protein ABIP71_03145 [Verrucomicrobiota bacterium]